MRFDLSLYLVLDPGLCAEAGMVETARAAVAGGVTMVQLRDKHATTAARIEAGRALKAALASTGALLIVNDDVEAVIAIGADGLHVGQDDFAPQEARARVGRDMVLGVSAETEVFAAGIDAEIVDYAGAGAGFRHADQAGPQGNRSGWADWRAGRGLAGAGGRHWRAEGWPCGRRAGGGAQGLAVVSAICGQPDPQAAARRIADEIEAWRR